MLGTLLKEDGIKDNIINMEKKWDKYSTFLFSDNNCDENLKKISYN